MTGIVFVVVTVSTKQCGKQREGATNAGAGTCRCAPLTLRFTVDCLSMESYSSKAASKTRFEYLSLMSDKKIILLHHLAVFLRSLP